ncbi:GTP-binding protein A [Folsomia candida]|uniref:GTP-binding protein A n=1 Tax=Folsomia candida TaxID=158441 RepID=A0A226DES0_FOLCA|nr:GTP-binding protein A [Folsomia candida]
MNILLLGETGAGKSTFINGLATYFTYPTIDDAKKNPFNPIIPIKFEVAGNTVEVGLDKNESGETGKSCTQQPRTYVMGWNGLAIRILDTPGIGDTRGVEQDQTNFTMILEHIKGYNYIHGICVFINSCQSRLTPFFRSCIKQLLAHLHQDAINNIVFVVTHGAPSFDPAVSIGTLKSILMQDLADVSIDINEKTVYCVDNDAVKYLAQKAANIPFAKEAKAANSAADSWEETYEQINRLFSVFQMMTPHDTTKTYSLNQTREICLALGGPLADCTKRVLEAQANILQKKDEVLKDLQDGLDLQAAQTTSTTLYSNVTDNENTWNACLSGICSITVHDRGIQIFIPRYCSSTKRSFIDELTPSSVFEIDASPYAIAAYMARTLVQFVVVICGTICTNRDGVLSVALVYVHYLEESGYQVTKSNIDVMATDTRWTFNLQK